MVRKKCERFKFFYNLNNVGIWADDSDNEDTKAKSFRIKKQPKSYTAPIGFVAGGVHQVGKKKENPDVKEEPESDDEKSSFKTKDSSEESEDEVPRAGK